MRPVWIARPAVMVWLLLASGGSAPHAALAADEPIAISTGPYLQNPTAESVTVMWMTNRNSTAWVEYGTDGAGMQRAISSHHGLIDANERIHRVTVSGLKPGARYQYRVCSTDILDFGAYKVQFGATVCSPPAGFHTVEPAAGAVSLLVFNDIHETRAVLPQMLEAIGQQAYDLVIFNGDILSQIDQERQVTDFLGDVVRQFGSRFPFVWVRGNHETRGSFARLLPNYVGLPQGRFYYSLDYGPVRFLVLDTGEDKEDSNAAYSGLVDFDAYRREQAHWLRQEIGTQAFRKARFRVALAHMPFPQATTRGNYGMNHANAQFGALMNEGKVDLLISGHTHSYALIQPVEGRHNYPILRGGGPTEQSRTVIRVEADRARLRATILRPGGAVAASTEVTARN